jgi:hypothetical protein
MYSVVVVFTSSSSSIVGQESGVGGTSVSKDHVVSSEANYYERAHCVMGCETWYLIQVRVNLGTFLFQRVLKSGGDSRFTEIKKKVNIL